MPQKFHIENMKCAGCVANAQKAIEGLDGVESVRVDLDGKYAEVTGSVDPALVSEAVSKAGYPTTFEG